LLIKNYGEKKMKCILIDCRYIGRALRHGRKSACLSLNECAKTLGVKTSDIVHYETGTQPIPDEVMHRLFHFGFLILRAKSMTNPNKYTK